MQAKIYYQQRPREYTITPKRRKLVKPLVQKSYNSFSVQCIMKNKETKQAIMKVIERVLRSEIATICSDNFNSISRNKSKQPIVEFECSIKHIINEMRSRAPTLYSLLTACLKTKTARPNENETMSFIFSIFCKHRRPSSCLFQRILSVVLYEGHASKRVSM